MCLSRSGVRVISGFRRALRMNGAIALTSCTSSSSTVEISSSRRRQELRPRRSTCCRSWSSSPAGNISLCDTSSSTSSGTCDSCRSVSKTRDVGPLVLAEQLPRVLGHSPLRRRLPFHHVRVERRRPANGLAGVVDDEVEAMARLQHLAAERLHAGRMSQVEAEDLEPIAPFAEIGLARVARRRIPRKARGDDEVGARTKQLESRLIADLHAAARQQARRGREDPRARCAWRNSARRTPGTSGRRSDGSASSSVCRRSSTAPLRWRGTPSIRSSTSCCSNSRGGNTFGE